MNKKLSLLIVLALAFTMLFSFTAPAIRSVEAAPAFEKVNFVDGTVTASYLNVRQGPSTKFPIVCTIKKGQAVKIFGKVNGWYAIYEVGTGCVGAVHNSYIKVGGTTTNKPAPKQTQKPAPKQTPKATPAPAQTPAPTPAPDPQQQTPSAPQEGISQDEQTILDLVNKARADAGVAPLQFDMELVKVARLKAQDMVENNYFSHQSPTYGSPFDMMKQFGISFKTAGENIAGNQTAEGAFKAWMNSEGHKKNILNGNFNYTGIGVASSKTYGKVFVQMFIGR